MTDFISDFDVSQPLVGDSLGHDEFALSLLRKVVFLPPGSAIALQGSWGHGKTDVLLRAAGIASDHAGDEYAQMVEKIIWINPWQYGNANLFAPIVQKLLAGIELKKRWDNVGLLRAAECVVRAGVGLSAGVSAAAGVPLASVAAVQIDKLVGHLFSYWTRRKARKEIVSDPIAEAGSKFRDLTEAALTRKSSSSRLLICVDDLDRCLPERQVAFLQAIRFLISAEAPATLLIAIDPQLATNAIEAHYGSTGFSAKRYLDKMFNLRVDLPAIDTVRRSKMIVGHIERNLSGIEGRPSSLGVVLGDSLDEFQKAAITVLKTPSLSNPRIVERIMNRLWLLYQGGKFDRFVGNMYFGFSWFGIIECWPEVRRAFQDAGESQEACDERLEDISHYLRYFGEARLQQYYEVVRRIPHSWELRDLFAVHLHDYQERYKSGLEDKAKADEEAERRKRRLEGARYLIELDKALVEEGL